MLDREAKRAEGVPPEADRLPAADEVASRIVRLEREARAREGDATLFHEVGRLWEEHQRSPRNAAIAYQNAYRLDRAHLPTLQSARRLFAEVGNWQMVAQLLEAEAEVTGRPEARARLLFERGLVLEQRLGRADEARTLHELALSVDPTNPAVLAHLETLHADGRDPAALASVCERLAGAIQDPPMQARYLAQAASLHEARLGDAETALRLYREAFALDRREPVILSSLQRHLERIAAHEELAEVARAAADAAGDGAAPALYRLARLLLRLDREDDALASLLAARRIAPRDRLVLCELGRIYEMRGAWESLADVLAARADAASDEAERIELLLELGALHEEKLDRRAEAIACYAAVTALDPTHGPALAALGKLHHQAGDWTALLATFEAEASATDDPRGQAARLYKAAQLLEERLASTEEAIARYDQILGLVPGYLPAQEALVRLFERNGRWSELVALLEGDLAGADRDQAIATLSRIAEIQETRQADPAAALSTYRRLLETAPDHLPSIRVLARLAERVGDWEALIEAHQREAARCSDQRQVVSLLHRNAEILEEKLGDRERAVEAWRKLLLLSPSYLPALRALGRIFRQRGRWTELVEMYRQEAEVTPDRETAAAMLFRVGELYDARLCDEKKAIAAFREVLELEPAHLPALRHLARIHRNRADWDALVGVLLEEAAARTDPLERACVLCQIAEIREERLGRPAEAREAWLEVLRLDPANAVALDALERLLTAAGAHRQLTTVYERQLSLGPPATRATASLKLARLYLDRLGEPGRAAALCEGALAADPDNLVALQLLERIRAAQGDRHRLAEVDARLAAHCADPRLASALRLHTGDRVALEAAVEANPRDAAAWERLERLLRQAGDHGALARSLERRLGAEDEAPLRLALLHRLGELRAGPLSDPHGALGAWNEALAIEPGNLPVLAALERFHEGRGAWAELHANLLAQAGASRDPAQTLELLLRASDLARDRLGDLDKAADACRRVLALQPTEPRATRRLEELLASGGGAEELARLHDQRAEAAANAGNATEAAEAWLAAARVRQEALGQPEAALELLEKALGSAPAHREALERKAAVASSIERWPEAAQSLSARIHLGGEPGSLASLLLQLARIEGEHLADPARAAIHAQAAADAAPESLEALRLACSYQVGAGNHAGAAAALRRLLAREPDDGARADLHGQLAAVLEQGFGDLAGAASCFERLLELRPDDRQALERLASLLERTRDLPRLVEVIERHARLVEAEDPAAAAALWSRAASIHAVPLRQPSRAVEAWRTALSLHPTARDARVALADHLAAESSTWDLAVDEHRRLLADDPLRAASWRTLHRLWRARGERDRAFVAAAVLELLGPEPAESAFYAEALASRRAAATGRADPHEIARLLIAPALDPTISALVEALGDELDRVVPPDLDSWGVGRSARLRPDDPHRAPLDSILLRLGADPAAFEAWGSPLPGALAIETTRPLSVILGLDLATATPSRVLLFGLARIAWRLRSRSAFLESVPPAEVAAILGAAVQLHDPGFEGFGPVDETLVRKLGKSLSRRARKALEEPARLLASEPEPCDVASYVEAARATADRAGLAFAGDPVAAIAALVPGFRTGSEEAQRALSAPDRLALLRFACSDEHFALRTLLGVALAG